MFDTGPGSSNGFMEKGALMIIVGVSVASAEWTASAWLTLWYAILGLLTLYLAWHFDQYSFSPEAWAQSHISGWSEGTSFGQPDSEFVQEMSDLREHVAPSSSIIWWFFRCSYILTGFVLLALAAERCFLGTSHIATTIFRIIGFATSH